MLFALQLFFFPLCKWLPFFPALNFAGLGMARALQRHWYILPCPLFFQTQPHPSIFPSASLSCFLCSLPATHPSPSHSPVSALLRRQAQQEKKRFPCLLGNTLSLILQAASRGTRVMTLVPALPPGDCHSSSCSQHGCSPCSQG